MRQAKRCAALAFMTALTLPGSPVAGKDVILARKGKALVTVYSPVELEAVKGQPKPGRPLLRASIKDLAHYLGKMSGTEVDLAIGEPPAKSKTIPILIAELGEKQFGPPGMSAPGKQGFRVVVSNKALACIGESDLAVSYAIYEILDRLGCRWYLGGDFGEVIPKLETVALPEMDESQVPATLLRGIWYASQDYKRRNRLGGLLIMGAHGLEGYLSAEQREEHPDWNAEFGGKRAPTGRICWGNPEVSDAVADEIIRRLDTKYQSSMTLSPGDGTSFCGCAKCRALDTGDMDPTMGCVSISDRLINFANRIVERVTKKYPDVLFGLYAYVQYTRAPLKEKPHPNIVMAIAPITYCRAHSMLNPNCSSRQSIRPIVEGWGKVAKYLAFRGYLFNLAEVNAPYPMISLWRDEFPIYYANNVRFWMPESMSTFEHSLPGLYLNCRLPWFPNADPNRILEEFYTLFYGAASEPMRRYWEVLDAAWTNTPEHAGNVFGHAARFTPEVMEAARQAANEAISACETAMEYRRVKFAEQGLKQFELFMKLRRDLAYGKIRMLEDDGDRFVGNWNYLQREYAGQAAFGRFQGQYFKRFFMPIYRDGSRIGKEYVIASGVPRKWKYQVDKDKQGEELGWHKPELDDQEWPETDPCFESWSSLGLHDYFGSVWYRANKVLVQKSPPGKKIFVWVACLDSVCKLFVNGRHIPYVNAKGETVDVFAGFSTPGSFDVTSAVKPGAHNTVAIIGTRPPGWLNEIGTGGLMGPVLFYREK